MLDAHVSDECKRLKLPRPEYRFSRRDVRRHVGWSDFQVRTHLAKLVDLEYVLVHRGGRGQSFVYELLYAGEGTDGKPFALGLIDPAGLAVTAGHVVPPETSTYDPKLEGETAKFEHQKGQFEGGSSIQSAPIEGGSCAGQSDESPGKSRAKRAKREQGAKNAPRETPGSSSYPRALYAQTDGQAAKEEGTVPASAAPLSSLAASSLTASSNGQHNGQEVPHGA